MVTTFTSRELVRDELVTLFVANGSWQEVYGYAPSVDELSGKTPILVIRSRGTIQNFANLETNPVTYRFVISSAVLAYSASDSWNSANAEDKLDELDKVVRQVIRNNAGSLTYGVNMRFETAVSEVSDPIREGLPYILESRFVLVDLPRGAI